jgi:outer membrane protein, multidrug efflux system
MTRLKYFGVGFSVLMVMGCASLVPTSENALDTASVAKLTTSQWQAPLPHNGRPQDLSQWWQQQGDALLVDLIDAAQAISPSLAAAKSRIGQSRAALTSSQAALAPTLDASASASRAVTQPGVPLSTTLQAGLMAGWEIDLFGAVGSASAAAAQRVAGAQATWHEARVAVAAEVAAQYVQLRACAQQAALAQQDAASKTETARLLGIATRAGFAAAGDLALTKATAADAANQVVLVGAQCEAMVKALVALTGFPEPSLKPRLANIAVNHTRLVPVYVSSVPAEALNQRPDLYASARDVEAARLDLASSAAQHYPRISLSGSIGALSFNAGGASTDMTTWSIGPLAVSLPLLDGGRRRANTDAAQFRYEEAVALYRAKVRQAVREVEQALVNLQAAADRRASTESAAQAWQETLAASLARQRNGFASQIDVEEARRQALAAETARLTLQRDQILAWVALYRAVGGGWQPPTLAATDRDSGK